MGWKEYQAQLTEAHDFGEFGCPDFEVALRRIDSFPYGEMKAYTSQAAKVAEVSKLAPEDPENVASFVAAAELNDEVLVKCIARWNIPHPETGEMLPLPSEDSASLDVLPSEFVAQMHIWLQEDSKLAELAGEAEKTGEQTTSPPRRGRRKARVASRRTKASSGQT